LLAVFGYPRAIDQREAAALAAALQIVGSRDVAAGLLVGVGIATGPVYVGSISAAGRAFWGATGDTTNRAARLQCLTRDVGAAVAMDARTFARAELSREHIQACPEMAIRGRVQPEDVFFVSYPAP
jgi:class 3 adenylate cyclase